MKTKLLIIAAATLVLASCTKKEPEASKEATDSAPVISAVGETMAFDKTVLTVKAGSQVTLTFKNPSSTLKHNWVLVKSGKENDVGIAGIKAGEAKNFIPDDPAVLAHTKLVDPKGEDKITFTAPPPGDYPYICTNAGHHTVMKGVLHSK